MHAQPEKMDRDESVDLTMDKKYLERIAENEKDLNSKDFMLD